MVTRIVQSLGKNLIFLGLALFLLGILILLAGRMGFPVGRLPGDISFRTKHFFVFAPLTTMILASVILTLVLNLVFRWFH